uniref:Uncharacterized protein n=1 Tax=Aegilops tauschii subsp. strangulata TaxID=200361 RepID=A0A453EHC1_AEGTS
MLQLQDGIQGAIAHCKRSFNASKGTTSPTHFRPLVLRHSGR